MEYTFSAKLQNLKPSAIREIFKSLSDPSIIAFAAGNPSPESFPVEELATISAQIYKDNPISALQYSITEGYPPLRNAIAERIKRKFNIGRDFDTTIVVSGGTQGIELTAKVLCNEGDAVICEDPTFIGALNAFRSNGIEVVGVPSDEGVIDPDMLERVIAATPRARMIYLIPTFHNPMGTTMPMSTRRAIYDICRRHKILILEDNPYGELRFAGEDVPTIKSIDDDGIVIYCSSFSKILSAGIRVGYVCAPEPVIQKMVVAKQVEDVHTNIFFQMVCHRYMTEYNLDGHIKSICDLYRRKSSLMLDALDEYMPDSVKFTRPQGGLFVWCTLPDSVELDKVVKAALERKVAIVPGTAFNCDTSKPSKCFRLNYSTPTDEQIPEGVRLLAEAIRCVQ